MTDPATTRLTVDVWNFHLDQPIATNTKTAHRLIHYADTHGREHDMVQRLFRAYFCEGRHIGDHASPVLTSHSLITTNGPLHGFHPASTSCSTPTRSTSSAGEHVTDATSFVNATR